MPLDELAGALTGSLVLPDHPDFETARLFHGRPGTPAGVVRAADVDDVRHAIAAARRAGLPVAVRGGGHSTWESVPGALVIDLRALNRVEVAPADPEWVDAGADADPGGPTLVRIGGGAVWGEVADALAPHGLAISSGDTRSVGVGGLTLGAGIGWLVRLRGLAIDQLVGAQVVTAAGDVLEVSEEAHPDLFWGLRGGGGNLGVVTRFDFRAHALPGIVRVSIELDGADLPALVRAFRDTLRAAPRELNGTLLRTPAMGPTMPSRTLMELAWAGTDEAAARAAAAPLLALPQVRSVTVAPAEYRDLLQEPPMPPPGVPMPTIVDQNGWFESLDDETVAAMIAALEHAETPGVLVRWLGGAFGDVAPTATAVAHRRAEAFVMTAGFVMPDAPPGAEDRMRAALEPFADLAMGLYGNFTNATTPGLAARMYPAATLARLRALKRAWDPENLFRRNHNVTPAPLVDPGPEPATPPSPLT